MTLFQLSLSSSHNSRTFPQFSYLTLREAAEGPVSTITKVVYLWPQFTHHFSLMTTAAAATTIITFSPSDLLSFPLNLDLLLSPSLSLSGSNFSPYWRYCHLGLMYFIYFISIRETKNDTGSCNPHFAHLRQFQK